MVGVRAACFAAGRRRGGRGFVQHAARLAPDLIGRHAQAAQHFHGGAIHADKSEQDVFRADVVMSEAPRLIHSELKHLLRFGRQLDLDLFRGAFPSRHVR